MPTYRVYYLDEGAHISQPPELFECVDDQEATIRARQFIDGKDIELWRSDFLVARFPKRKARTNY